MIFISKYLLYLPLWINIEPRNIQNKLSAHTSSIYNFSDGGHCICKRLCFIWLYEKRIRDEATISAVCRVYIGSSWQVREQTAIIPANVSDLSDDPGVNRAIGISLLAESHVATDSTRGNIGSTQLARHGPSRRIGCSYGSFGLR